MISKAEVVAQKSGLATVMKWCDKRNVVMISTHHEIEMETEPKRGKKEQNSVCVTDCNNHKGDVDFKDQVLKVSTVNRLEAHTQVALVFNQNISEPHRAELHGNLYARHWKFCMFIVHDIFNDDLISSDHLAPIII
jgi:hypothetical protein